MLRLLSGNSLLLKGVYQIKSGDTIANITHNLSTLDRIKFKRYSLTRGLDFKDLKI